MGLAQQNYNKEITRAKSAFRRKYPNAILEHFEFWNWPNKDGTVTDPTRIVYRADGKTKLYNETGTTWKYSWPVDSQTFRNKYRSVLFFGPSEIWQTQGKEQPFSLEKRQLPFDLTTFPISIGITKSFKANFDALDTAWKNADDDNSILHSDITKYAQDPYLASLVACYVVTVKSGICLKHFEADSKVPNITTSILRYYLYYNMARFLHNPSKLKNYVSLHELSVIQKHIPTKKVWQRKYDEGNQATISAFKASKRGVKIRNVKYYGGSTGVIGIQLVKVTNLSDDDWIQYIPQVSNGLTSYGLLFLQNAVESYVYAVLGSQARTKWPIVGQGAKSLQTQHTFEKIVRDTLIQDNEDVLVEDMQSHSCDQHGSQFVHFTWCRFGSFQHDHFGQTRSRLQQRFDDGNANHEIRHQLKVELLSSPFEKRGTSFLGR